MAKAKKAVKKKPARQKPKPKPAPATTKPPAKKVWMIMDHENRLQSSTQKIDVLQTSSPYIQMPIRPRTAELILFTQQLDALMVSERTRLAWMAYWLLAKWSYDAAIRYKGFLLGVTHKPATVKEIAAKIFTNPNDAKKTLTILKRGGLIEQVECPDFPNMTPPKGRTEGWRERAAAKKKAEEAAKKKAGKNQQACATPQNATLKKKPKDKSLRTASGKAAAPPETKETANGSAEAGQRAHTTETAEGVIEITLENADNPGNGNPDNDSPNPTSAPPTDMPTVADGGQGRGHASQDQARPLPPPDISPQRAPSHRTVPFYNDEARQFAGEIYIKLNIPHSVRSPEGARELANFAGAWTNAQAAGLSPDQLAHLWAKATKSAVTLATKRRSRTFTKSPEAVWRYLFNERLSAQTQAKSATA